MPAKKYDKYNEYFGGTEGGGFHGEWADYEKSGGLGAFRQSQGYKDFTTANPRWWEGANSLRNKEAYDNLREEHLRSWDDALYKGTSKEGSGYWNTPAAGATAGPAGSTPAGPPPSGITSMPTPQGGGGFPAPPVAAAPTPAAPGFMGVDRTYDGRSGGGRMGASAGHVGGPPSVASPAAGTAPVAGPAPGAAPGAALGATPPAANTAPPQPFGSFAPGASGRGGFSRVQKPAQQGLRTGFGAAGMR